MEQNEQTTKLPKRRTTVSARKTDDMDSLKSEGGILSDMPARYKGGSKPTGKIFITLLLLIALGGGAYYFWGMPKKTTENTPTPTNTIVEKTTEELLIEAVAKTTTLPSGTPTIETITNPAALAVKDAFFLGALEGDKLLVYSAANKVFLYSPTRELLVNSAELTTTNSSIALTTVSPTPTETEAVTASVEIRNGTAVAGLAKKTSDIITKNKSFRVEGIGNAANQEYPKTIIFSLHPEAAPLAETLAQLLGGEVVGSLPKAESLPSTDIVVILGE